MDEAGVESVGSAVSREEELVGYANVIEYLEKKTYPENASKNDKRAIRQKATSYLLVDSQLYHKGHKGKLGRVVTCLQERERILANVHGGLIGGCHYGQKATLQKVSFNIYSRIMS